MRIAIDSIHEIEIKHKRVAKNFDWKTKCNLLEWLWPEFKMNVIVMKNVLLTFRDDHVLHMIDASSKRRF